MPKLGILIGHKVGIFTGQLQKVSSIYPDVEEQDGELYVSFWSSSDRFFIKPEGEMPNTQSFGMTMGGR